MPAYPTPTSWQPNTDYANGAWIVPTDTTLSPFYFRAICAGTTGACEPAWTAITTLGATVKDGWTTWCAARVAPFIDLKDLEDRLGRDVVRQILDDNNDGFADMDPIARICFESTSYCTGLLDGLYVFPMGSPYPDELRRICLDVAAGKLYIRHPEIARYDGNAALDRARTELKDVRAGISRLGTPPVGDEPNPPAPAEQVPGNIGGLIVDNSNRMVIDSADGTSNNSLL